MEEDSRSTIRDYANRANSCLPCQNQHQKQKNDLKLIQFCACWIPRLFTSEMKDARVSACQANLQRVKEVVSWKHFREQIVTVDETKITFFDQLTKQESMVSNATSDTFQCNIKFVFLANLVEKWRESADEGKTSPALPEAHVHHLL